jgi:hypothetical protein
MGDMFDPAEVDVNAIRDHKSSKPTITVINPTNANIAVQNTNTESARHMAQRVINAVKTITTHPFAHLNRRQAMINHNKTVIDRDICPKVGNANAAVAVMSSTNVAVAVTTNAAETSIILTTKRS